MFNPSREQVRDLFFAIWRKYRAGEPLAGIEAVALDAILLHPEYHELLSNPARFREKDYVDESNPFLHMSLHVAFEEQLSIDQPPGVAGLFGELLLTRQDQHEARHAAIECLAEMMWRAQREARAPDAQSYLDCIKKKIGGKAASETGPLRSD